MVFDVHSQADGEKNIRGVYSDRTRVIPGQRLAPFSPSHRNFKFHTCMYT